MDGFLSTFLTKIFHPWNEINVMKLLEKNKEDKVLHGVKYGKLHPDTLLLNQETLLIFAIKNKKLKLLNGVIEFGADVNKQNKMGEKPIEIAIQMKYPEAGKALLRKEVDLKYLDPKLFHQAIESFFDLSIYLMVDSEASLLKATDELGQTPLMKAILLNRIEVVKDLINWGVDLNLQDNKQETALMKAVQTQNKVVVHLLLSSGAKVDIKNENGETALHQSILKEDEKISQILIKYDTDLLLENKRGEDPYNLAMKQGKIKLAKFIQKKVAERLKKLNFKSQVTPFILLRRLKKMFIFNEKARFKD